MRVGIYIRNMGPQATRGVVVACARAAEDAGLDDVWVGDHVAIPPDDAEGSDGRYLDQLATLAFLAGCTSRIGLGAGVVVLPYRPPLPTAKWVATIQELSGGRLTLGVGAGWMQAEFRALGVEWARRGATTDATLEFLHRCFADDVVVEHGQPFLFRPRPPRPPILVGGTPPHGLRRAARFGDGWMPMAPTPEGLASDVATLRRLCADAGKPAPQVVAATRLPLDDDAACVERVRAFAAAGATGVVHGWRYTDADEFRAAVTALAAMRAAVSPPSTPPAR